MEKQSLFFFHPHPQHLLHCCSCCLHRPGLLATTVISNHDLVFRGYSDSGLFWSIIHFRVCLHQIKNSPSALKSMFWSLCPCTGKDTVPGWTRFGPNYSTCYMVTKSKTAFFNWFQLIDFFLWSLPSMPLLQKPLLVQPPAAGYRRFNTSIALTLCV